MSRAGVNTSAEANKHWLVLSWSADNRGFQIASTDDLNDASKSRCVGKNCVGGKVEREVPPGEVSEIWTTSHRGHSYPLSARKHTLLRMPISSATRTSYGRVRSDARHDWSRTYRSRRPRPW